MHPRTDRRQLLLELVEHCSHTEHGLMFRQILRAFLFFFGNSFNVCHYHDVSDFSVDHVDRYFTEYVSNQGVGIGSVLSSLLAFLKQHFALQRVLQGQVTNAVLVTVADNCFIVGAAKSVASLLVRSFKVDQGQRGALWHESEILRFVPDPYCNGTYNMSTPEGRAKISARIKAAFTQCVRQVSADSQLHSRVRSLLTSTPVRLRGTKFVGVFIGNPAYRQHNLRAAFRNVEREVIQLQPYTTVTSQSKMVCSLNPYSTSLHTTCTVVC